MKHIILIAVGLMTAGLANAASSELKDMSYFTMPGKWLISVGATKSLKDGERQYQNGQKTGAQTTIENKYFNSSFGLEYGLADKFVLGIGGHYLFSSKRINDTGAAIKNNGFSDPTISAAYRYMTGMWTGDALVDITPDFGKAKTDAGGANYGSTVGNYSGRQHGGLYQGGSNEFSLGTKIVYPMGMLEYGVTPMFWYHSKTTIDMTSNSLLQAATSTSHGEIASYMNFGGDLAARYHHDNCYFNGSLGVTAPYKTKFQTNSTDTTVGSAPTVTLTNTTPNITEYSVPFHVTPKLMYGHQFASTGWAAEIGVAYDRYDIGIQQTTSAGVANAAAQTNEISNTTGMLNLKYEM